jgi:hypothetical protein
MMKKIQVRKPGKAAALLQLPSTHAILAGCLMLIVSIGFLLAVSVMASDVKTITNIKEWHHPVKAVLLKHHVEIIKVELHNQTYPVFYVKFPYDPWLGHNDKFFKPLYYETLKANGFWDYAFVDQSSEVRINIKWDKKTKTLSEGMESVK